MEIISDRGIKKQESMNLGIEEIKNELGSMYTGYRVRCNERIAELILEDGLFFWYSRPCFPNIRRVFHDVWEVFLEDQGSDIHLTFIK